MSEVVSPIFIRVEEDEDSKQALQSGLAILLLKNVVNNTFTTGNNCETNDALKIEEEPELIVDAVSEGNNLQKSLSLPLNPQTAITLSEGTFSEAADVKKQVEENKLFLG